jgi:hypothetical protein
MLVYMRCSRPGLLCRLDHALGGGVPADRTSDVARSGGRRLLLLGSGGIEFGRECPCTPPSLSASVRWWDGLRGMARPRQQRQRPSRRARVRTSRVSSGRSGPERERGEATGGERGRAQRSRGHESRASRPADLDVWSSSAQLRRYLLSTGLVRQRIESASGGRRAPRRAHRDDARSAEPVLLQHGDLVEESAFSNPPDDLLSSR